LILAFWTFADTCKASSSNEGIALQYSSEQNTLAFQDWLDLPNRRATVLDQNMPVQQKSVKEKG
jgi:hypothetical protein